LCSVASELSDVVIPLESTTYRLKRELVVWPQHLIHMEFWNHILNQSEPSDVVIPLVYADMSHAKSR